jgi:hypothetical protein
MEGLIAVELPRRQAKKVGLPLFVAGDSIWRDRLSALNERTTGD